MVCTTSLPVTLYQGSSISFFLNLTNSLTGLPIDLSVYSAIVAEIPATAGPPCIMASLGSGITVVSPAAAGQLQISYTSSQTLLMALTNNTDGVTYTPLTVYLTDTSDLNQNPYILVIPNVFNIVDPPC